MDISKSDWKLYLKKVGVWQESYIEKLNKEYIELLSAPGNASDHFWELEKRIKQDKKHPRVSIELSKADAIWDIAFFISDGVITMENLDGFSKELVNEVKAILDRGIL